MQFIPSTLLYSINTSDDSLEDVNLPDPENDEEVVDDNVREYLVMSTGVPA
jgi:hypothetical protein